MRVLVTVKMGDVHSGGLQFLDLRRDFGFNLRFVETPSHRQTSKTQQAFAEAGRGSIVGHSQARSFHLARGRRLPWSRRGASARHRGPVFLLCPAVQQRERLVLPGPVQATEIERAQRRLGVALEEGALPRQAGLAGDVLDDAVAHPRRLGVDQ